ncbi:MAG: nuclear transport factor 2 family protein [Mycobacterium sp.]
MPIANTDPATAVTTYLAEFYRGDFERAREVVAEDFSFEGPFLQVQGKEAFFEGAEGLRQIVRGHRLIQQWIDGDEVSSLYEVDIHTPHGQGALLMSEWHSVQFGQLVRGRVVFDTVPFRSLMAPPDVEN